LCGLKPTLVLWLCLPKSLFGRQSSRTPSPPLDAESVT